MSNSFFQPVSSISHTSTLNAERGQPSIAAARMTARYGRNQLFGAGGGWPRRSGESVRGRVAGRGLELGGCSGETRRPGEPEVARVDGCTGPPTSAG